LDNRKGIQPVKKSLISNAPSFFLARPTGEGRGSDLNWIDLWKYRPVKQRPKVTVVAVVFN